MNRDPGTRWDPNQYLKFSDHRLRPALELLDRVPLKAPALIYDLKCAGSQAYLQLAREVVARERARGRALEEMV